MRYCIYYFIIIKLFSCSQKETLGVEKSNIIWLIIEDFSPDLSCYGYDQIRTPNIDRLASEGIMFTNAFTTAPVCSPSRSAIMTGMYQTSIGAHHHRSHRNDGYTLDDGIKTAPIYFKEAGYYTSNIKKGFSTFKGTGKTDLNFKHQKLFEGKHWDSLKVNQPFYAQINFAPVHRMMYKRPDTLTVSPDTLKLPPYYPDHPIARYDWAEYITKIELLDGMVGEVLQKLKKDSLDDNTIVMLLADHGRSHIRGKQWLYDEGIKVPLLIKVPTKSAGIIDDRLISGIDLLPTSLDFAGISIPSHMEGKSFANGGEIREYVVAARDRCDESVEYVRAIRNKQFKYIKNFQPELPYMQSNKYKEAYYPMWLLIKDLKKKNQLTKDQLKFTSDSKPEEELYDIIEDPDELNNLAQLPEFYDIKMELRDKLLSWQIQTKDQGRHQEDSVVQKKWQEKIMQWDVTEEIENIKKQISTHQ